MAATGAKVDFQQSRPKAASVPVFPVPSLPCHIHDGMPLHIALLEDESAIARSFELMSVLRPHLQRESYVATVLRLMDTGYRLVGLEDGGLRALAGVRTGEWLHAGRYLEVEELVTGEADRSRGYGRALLAWIADHARSQGCRQVRLVSGVRRVDAHRFYEREGMVWEAKYFSMDVGT